jgi:hypothetical protein
MVRERRADGILAVEIPTQIWASLDLVGLTRIPKLNLALPGQLFESELPALITSRTEECSCCSEQTPHPSRTG